MREVDAERWASSNDWKGAKSRFSFSCDNFILAPGILSLVVVVVVTRDRSLSPNASFEFDETFFGVAP